MGLKERLDDAQQGHEKTGIALATFKKFSEDNSTNLAGLIAFWAFFSIFPLFLVLVTILGWVLPGGTKQDVLSNVAQLFPLLDPQSVGRLSGSWWALVVGLATALWSGTAVVRAVQFAFNSVWEIKEKDRPNLAEQLGRSLLALVTIGLGLVLATLISGFVTGDQQDVNVQWYTRIAGWLVAIALDIGLFVAAFRLLTDRDVSTRDVLPGAVLSGLVFFLLQQLSSLIISRYLGSAQDTYGNFATVITILWWFYLQAIVTLLGAELNVVLKADLHPRSFVGGPETEADHRALEAYAEQQTYHEEEEVDARVEGEDAGRRAARAPRQPGGGQSP